MAKFTAEELKIIRQQRKSNEDLPKYYSAESKAETQISRDFESYLILQSPAQKQKILSWIKEATKIQKPRVDRDELIKRYMANRIADADARISDLTTQTTKFESLRSELIGDSTDVNRFADVIEVGIMVNSLQRPIDELLSLKERAYHDKVMATVYSIRFAATENNKDTQRELSSWQTVVSAYPGRNA